MTDEPSVPNDERPPLGSWRRLYAVVLLTDVALIALFTWFTLHFD